MMYSTQPIVRFQIKIYILYWHSVFKIIISTCYEAETPLIRSPAAYGELGK